MSGLPLSHDQLALDGAGYQLGAQADAGRPVRLLHQALSLKERIAKGEALLKELKAQLREIEENVLPTSMDEVGLEKLQTDGFAVAVESIITGSITEENSKAACEWLRSHGHGQLVQHTLVVNFKRKGDDEALKLRRQLEQQGADFTEKEVVHHMSLKAFAREQIQRGIALPYDLLGLWVGRRAVIKPIKEK